MSTRKALLSIAVGAGFGAVFLLADAPDSGVAYAVDDDDASGTPDPTPCTPSGPPTTNPPTSDMPAFADCASAVDTLLAEGAWENHGGDRLWLEDTGTTCVLHVDPAESAATSYTVSGHYSASEGCGVSGQGEDVSIAVKAGNPPAYLLNASFGTLIRNGDEAEAYQGGQ